MSEAFIPYARQNLDEDDIAAVVEVLRGDWLTQGPNIGAFEAAVADREQRRAEVGDVTRREERSSRGRCAMRAEHPRRIAEHVEHGLGTLE